MGHSRLFTDPGREIFVVQGDKEYKIYKIGVTLRQASH